MHEIIIEYGSYELRVEYDYSHDPGDRDTPPYSEVKVIMVEEHEPDKDWLLDIPVDESELRDLIQDKINDGELASDF